MLTYVIRDINGKTTKFKKPVSVNIVSSEDAPANSLYAVFTVSGFVPVLDRIDVFNGSERIFFGKVDSQTTEKNKNGQLLTIKARSMECVLLDNEALPQTYCMPSMPLLMKRHFEPLGFDSFIGTAKAFSGELTITKGMSEWGVLSAFCRHFMNTVPKMDSNGVINITGDESSEVVYLSSDRCISVKSTLDRSSLISEIYARTYTAGGYEMPLENDFARQLGVKKIRYVNSIDSESRTVLSTREIIKKSNQKYERIEIEYVGCILCERGAKLVLDNNDRNIRVREIHYTLDSNGERTKIYSEVRY